MTYLRISLGILICLLTFNNTINAQEAVTKQDSIIGSWSILSNQAAIKITEKDGIFRGQIIWLSEPTDKNDLPRLDLNNNIKSKRSQPILYMICLYGFEYNEASNAWENGYFYNPFTGDTMKATLKMKDSNTVEMSGYAGFSLEFKTESWVRF